MSYQYKEEDTETWILLFLYNSPAKTIEDMVHNGCHKMILKVPFDDLVKILDKMAKSNLIGKYYYPTRYNLRAKGMHKLRNLVLAPLLNLTSEQAHLVIKEIKSSCDTKLLEDLYGDLESQLQDIPEEKVEDMVTSKKIQIIKRHGLQKLDIILNIVGMLNKIIGIL